MTIYMNENTTQKKHTITIQHTFPLRDENDTHNGLDITITLPRDLCEIEAERIADFINSLAR